MVVARWNYLLWQLQNEADEAALLPTRRLVREPAEQEAAAHHLPLVWPRGGRHLQRLRAQAVPDLLEQAPLHQVIQLILGEDALLVGGVDLSGELWLNANLYRCEADQCSGKRFRLPKFAMR